MRDDFNLVMVEATIAKARDLATIAQAGDRSYVEEKFKIDYDLVDGLVHGILYGAPDPNVPGFGIHNYLEKKITKIDNIYLIPQFKNIDTENSLVGNFYENIKNFPDSEEIKRWFL